jgi:hypothetical protein
MVTQQSSLGNNVMSLTDVCSVSFFSSEEGKSLLKCVNVYQCVIVYWYDK